MEDERLNGDLTPVERIPVRDAIQVGIQLPGERSVTPLRIDIKTLIPARLESFPLNVPNRNVLVIGPAFGCVGLTTGLLPAQSTAVSKYSFKVDICVAHVASAN